RRTALLHGRWKAGASAHRVRTGDDARMTHDNPRRKAMHARCFTRLAAWVTGALVALVTSLALAQAPVEVSFYYPVAVGGPITKIIDGYAADFEKENPGIKLKPIYSGSYQESITKALTAVKS